MPPDAPPPWAEAVIILPEKLEAVACDSDAAGVFVDKFGRLSIAMNGRGLRATFGTARGVAAVALVLTQMAELLAAAEREAAESAAADLARIASKSSAEGKTQ